jgi:hypothetical protein
MKTPKTIETPAGFLNTISVTMSSPEMTNPRMMALRQLGGRSTRGPRFLLRARCCASARLRGRPRRLVSIRPPWVPRCLRRLRFLVCAMP